jgi:hypothetical protein
VRMGQKFRPPKLNDRKSWEVVLFLVENGFRYGSIYLSDGNGGFLRDPHTDLLATAEYPTKLSEAKLFVQRYKKHSEPFEMAVQRNHRVGR